MAHVCQKTRCLPPGYGEGKNQRSFIIAREERNKEINPNAMIVVNGTFHVFNNISKKFLNICHINAQFIADCSNLYVIKNYLFIM
jgi:hypothetical protein